MRDDSRTDRPRTNADSAEIARKLALLGKPHIKPLSVFVQQLRAEHGDPSIPWFDPTEAGTKARILLLLEAPGRKATARHGSGFVSPDNNDPTAENMWKLLREARVDRRHEVVTWNVVPWYLGSDHRIRRATSDDVREAHDALARLLRLLPRVRVIVLLGQRAAEAWEIIGVDLPTIRAPHPSPKNLNSRPNYRGLILQSLHDARQQAGYTNRKGAAK